MMLKSLNKKSSPLRYPGGKSSLYNKVKTIMEDNNLCNSTYVEPFSGGYGIGLQLMKNHIVDSFIINDYDYHIYAFWKTLFLHTKQLIDFINKVNITIEEWQNQREIYNNYKDYSLVEVGCSTLFLNRTNYSGILKGGPIGGFSQSGSYKLHCRFNKQTLIENIKEIASFKKHVKIYNLDAIKLITKLTSKNETFFYNFDPPYVKKGQELYENFYNEDDHIRLHNKIDMCVKDKWIMTYDKCEFIKKLYNNYYVQDFELSYVAGKKKKGTEYFISNFYIEEKRDV